MAANIRRVEYYDVTLRDRPAEGYRLLSLLEGAGVDLLAFHAVPMGPDLVRFALFTQDVDALKRLAQEGGMQLTGPQHALLVQGEDDLGALVDVHKRISDAGVNIFASWGVMDGRGGYGCVLFVRSERYEEAARALGL